MWVELHLLFGPCVRPVSCRNMAADEKASRSLWATRTQKQDGSVFAPPSFLEKQQRTGTGCDPYPMVNYFPDESGKYKFKNSVLGCLKHISTNSAKCTFSKCGRWHHEHQKTHTRCISCTVWTQHRVDNRKKVSSSGLALLHTSSRYMSTSCSIFHTMFQFKLIMSMYICIHTYVHLYYMLFVL